MCSAQSWLALALGLWILTITSTNTSAQTTDRATSETNAVANIVFKFDVSTAGSRPVKFMIQHLAPPRHLPVYQTFEEIPAGIIPLTFTNLEDGFHHWKISAPGQASQTRFTEIRNGLAKTNEFTVKLFPQRYVILRYALNTVGRRSLDGDEVETGRFAVAHSGGLPEFSHDWNIYQYGDGSGEGGAGIELQFFRFAPQFGFAIPPENVSFDALKEAPGNEAYKCESIRASKGLTLFCRINANYDKGIGYGKILVEDITDTPPAGIPVIDHSLMRYESRHRDENVTGTATNHVLKINFEFANAAPSTAKVQLRKPRDFLAWRKIEGIQPGVKSVTFSNLTGGTYLVDVSSKGFASQVSSQKLDLNKTTSTELDVNLFRQRYVILRYAFNSGGGRNLEGDGITTGRMALGHLSSPREFKSDWIIRQNGDGSGSSGNTMELHLHRIVTEFGFAVPPEKISFDDLKEAPADDAYLCRSIRAFKGLILFSRIRGNSGKGTGYGKIIVEDITDTPPEGVEIMDLSSR